MPGGRPTVLSAELTENICRLVKGGTPIEIAAETYGVSRHTILEWVRRGEGADERPADDLHIEFANRYREAKGVFHQVCLQLVQEALTGSRQSKKDKTKRVKSKLAPWRVDMAMRLLARRFPEFWGAAREAPANVHIDMVSAMQQLQATPSSARAAITKYFGNVTPEGGDATLADAPAEEPARRPDDSGGAPGE